MASLLLGDLNDYIEPSQACIIPVAADNSAQKKQEVSINLTDCLACSGCITSAETVLVAQQTYNRLLEAVDSGSYAQVAVSVSPQTVAALAARYGTGSQAVWSRLSYFFKHVLQASLVFDTTHSRSLTLSCLAREFIAWNKQDNAGPLIVSACPGWVCYAEKRYKEFLPMLSRTRSPQQMAGALVKHFWRDASVLPDRIFHCTVMPCFDKKLEASRADFVADTLTMTRDVDTVITTSELLQILLERMPTGLTFETLPEDPNSGSVARHEGSGSGGYLEHVLGHAIRTLYPEVPGKIVQVPGRNADSTETHFVDTRDSRVLLRFAAISGFRNIQTFVVKQKKASGNSEVRPLDFVEIMACPGGCLNGGGQPKPDVPSLSRAAMKDHLERINVAYKSAPLIEDEPALLRDVLDWVDADPDARRHLLMASYTAVEEHEQLRKAINVQW